MANTTSNLHTSLLRPSVIHILRAAGFHSTRPSVLDTLVNLTERHLLLLARTTAEHALLSHNSLIPGLTDVRLALGECGVLGPVDSAAEEEWRERKRRGNALVEGEGGGEERVASLKRKRDARDVREVETFERWVLGGRNAEIRRVAGILPDVGALGVGVGGEAVVGEDWLTVLRKKVGRGGEEERLRGTVLGEGGGGAVGGGEIGPVVIEGGPVGSLDEWARLLRERAVGAAEKNVEHANADEMDTSESTLNHEEVPEEDGQGVDEDIKTTSEPLQEVKADDVVVPKSQSDDEMQDGVKNEDGT